MNKKYQIFVSSTYEDLKEERDVVIKAILEMGHFPVGMEMFSAGDEQQWQLIKKQIDDCDYYVVISAFRYGSLDGDIGYTEKEYDYAKSIGVPTLGFVINEGVSWPASKVDKDAQKVEKLGLFKDKIKTKLVSYWNDKNDLYGKVSIALMKQFNTNPRIGWVKSIEYNSPEILNEVSRLSKENSELREKIDNYNFKEKKEEQEHIENTLNILRKNKRHISFFYKYGKDWENNTEFELYKIFNFIAPEIMIENSTDHCNTYLGKMFNPDNKKELRSTFPIPTNTIKRILADLSVLDLINPSTKKHQIKDTNEYWSLTEFGKKVYKMMRQEIMLKNIEESEDTSSIND
jgi:regulator of replication initiation timing/DNA-binding HxlR family transcriptional regulator